MYVIATVTLTDLQGNEDDYEVGAWVEPAYDNYGGREVADGHTVGEPDFSAPGCTLKESRIAHDPQGGEVFPSGWSDVVEEALTEAYVAKCEDLRDDLDPPDHMYGED